jgi:hypothetical protein
MKLNEFNKSPSIVTKRALKEHYDVKLPLNRMNLSETSKMLRKVRSLIAEAKSSSISHRREKDASYMKLVFMEQALVHHYGNLKAMPAYNQRIVVENEEVQKSQVILSAQELSDSIQKMIEDVSDMLVKELPAITDGVNNEIGANEGSQFNSQMSEALTALQSALTQAKTGVDGAIGVVTGQGGMDMEMPGEQGAEGMPDMGDEEMGDEEMADMGDEEMGGEAPMPEEEPDDEGSDVGRELR